MATQAEARIEDCFPAGTLITDAAECAFYAEDVFTSGPTPLAVFRPGNIDELAAGLMAAAGKGLSIVPRGGGMSYTSGYVADAAGALIVDMGRMTRILAIDETDMTVTVEAGISWGELYDTLKPRGLRMPLWGTLSGIKASVGGGMSQNGLFWGATRGTIAATALSFDVVLADGNIVRTGNGFLRPYGPDVTGLFASDAGAFGIKAHITLPLIAEAEALAYGSFSFDAPAQFCAAMSAIARAGLASESFGFDPFLQAQRMRRDSLSADAKQLVGMMTSQGGFWKGLKEGAKVLAAGRSFLDDARFSIHLIAEGLTQSDADERMRRIGAVVTKAGGQAVENTIPKVLRANPFPPVNSMVGPDGERWVPVHGIVRHSKALGVIEAITALYEGHAHDMERLGVGAGYMFLTVATTGFLIEPVFYWPDALSEIHRRSVEQGHLAKLKRFPADADARALVETLRAAVIAIIQDASGMHFQIGRTYPLKNATDPRAWRMLEAVKRDLDPEGRMNPGSARIVTYAAVAMQLAAQTALEAVDPRAAMLAHIGHVAQRVRDAATFIEQYGGAPLKLAVLPEYLFTSYPARVSIPDFATRVGWAIDGPEYAAIGRVAQDLKLYLAGNAYEVDAHFPGLYFQASFIAAPSGNVVLRYRRLNSMYAPTPHDVWSKYLDLYGIEGVFPVARTEIGNLAAIASEEILYPEIARAHALRGAEIFVHSSSEIGSPLRTPKMIAKQARAFENMAYVVSANTAGIDGFSSADGNSMIVDWKGDVLAESNAGETYTAFADIDVSALREKRNRPGMTNMLSRQRTELFASTYAAGSHQQANALITDGVATVPDRDHFNRVQAATIARLAKDGLI